MGTWILHISAARRDLVREDGLRHAGCYETVSRLKEMYAARPV
jgi:hypothetical protein